MAMRNTGGPDDPRDTTSTPGGGSGSPPTLKDQAVDLGRKATSGVRQAATQAQSQARSRLERGKADAAVTLTSVATSLLNSGMQLRDDEQVMAGEYVERAARQDHYCPHVGRFKPRPAPRGILGAPAFRVGEFARSGFAIGRGPSARSPGCT